MVEKKPNFLSAAEIAVEGNYNMVGDGIINNVPKPSMLERLEAIEQRKRERHRADIKDSRRERHREERHQAAEER